MTTPQNHGALRLPSGETIALAERLGGGGEGTVHAVQGQSNVVAKIYHAGLSGERLQKLTAMINAGTPALSAITAWPSALIFSSTTPVGFLMPRATKAEEVHVLYGLKSRKQKFPNAGFRFLVLAAANIARAFATVHQHGIVIGDINERVAMIGLDATVRLIDCDSFQITEGAKRFRCVVGVPTFTPPELQHLQSFRDADRTEQHDAFGLAVLIFHLLFLGRHPFAGRYGKPTDMPIETAIHQHRFAYSANRTRTLMVPPPNTPALTHSGPGIATLFEQAFSPEAASGRMRRPSAAQWTETLSGLLSELVPCKVNAAHAYVPTQGSCPWCGIELNSRIEIFNYFEPAGAAASAVDSEAIWRAIEALQPVYLSPIPNIAALKQGLEPTRQAQLLKRYRAEQKSLAAARLTLAESTRVVMEYERLVQERETLATKALEHVKSFESDGTRLLELQQKFVRTSQEVERLGMQKGLTLWSTGIAAIICVLAQQMHNLAFVICAAGILVFESLSRLRREKESALRRDTIELHELRASIDLGIDHRKALAASAAGAIEDARQELGIKIVDRERAAQSLQQLQQHAVFNDGEMQAVTAALANSHRDALLKFNALSGEHRGLQSELLRAWQNIIERKLEAQKIYDKIRDIESKRTLARQEARNKAQHDQLNQYLDQFFITRETWPRIPRSALIALSSYGIETAADITREDVLKVPGFGAVRTQMLLDWRQRKARGFRFDPTKDSHSHLLPQLDRKLSSERREHERALVKVKAQIDALVAQLSQRKASHDRDLADAAQRAAQSLVDGDALQLPWS